MSDEKILIVEDEGLTAMELQRKLKFWGYEVPTFAFSKSDALKKAEKIKPDLVLMDIVLKGEGDGIEAAKEIVERFDSAVIYITAYSDEKTLKRAKVTKHYAYLLKPFDENELHEKIELALYQHNVEKRLKRTGEYLDKTLKDSGAAVIVTDSEGFVKYMNQFAEEYTGYKQGEALFNDLIEIFNIKPLKSEIEKIPVNEVLKEEMVADISHKAVLMTKDGREIPIEYRAKSIRNDKGDFIGATLVFEDISKRKVEESLFKSEKRFKTVYSQSPVGMEIYDENGQFIDANKACLDLFGVEEISDLSEFQLFRDFKIVDKEKKELSKGKSVNYEVEFDFKDFKEFKLYKTTKSGIIYLEVIISPLKEGEDGTLSGYLVQFQDITKHRIMEESLERSKENYRGLLESIEDIFFAVDQNLNCIFWNKACKDFTGISSKDAMGKSVYELFPSFKGTNSEKLFSNVLETGVPRELVEKFQGGGETSFLMVNVYPSKRGLSVFIKDVTEAKLSEESLKERERLYQDVISDQTEIICRFTPNGEITFTNDAYINHFDDGVIEGEFMFLSPGEYHGCIKEQMENFSLENPIKIFETQVEMQNKHKWIQWTTKAIFDHEWHIVEFQAVGRDITQLREVEENLKQEYLELAEDIKKRDAEFATYKESSESEITRLNEVKKQLRKEQLKLKEKSKTQVEELIKEKKIVEDKLAHLKQTEEVLRQEHVELEDQARKEAEKFKGYKEALEIRITELKETVKNFEDRIAELKETKEQLRKEQHEIKERSKKQVGELKKEKERLEDKLASLKETEEQIKRSLREKDTLLREIHNQVKKNMQIVSSLVGLQTTYIQDEIIKKFRDSQSYIKSISLVHEKLYESKDLESINFSEYIQSLTSDLFRSYGADKEHIKMKIDIEDAFLDIDTATSCGLIINELISNSLKHAFPDGREGKIEINLYSEDENLILAIEDDGVGLSKNMDIQNLETLGLQLVYTLVQQIGGNIDLNRDHGTKFKIEFPEII